MESSLDDTALNALLSQLQPDNAADASGIPDSPTADIISAMPGLTTDEHIDPADGSISVEETPSPTLEEGIWTRQPGETARAYECFSAYRDLGPGRSMVEAYRHKTGKETAKQSSGHWNTWYRVHDWRRRAEAYDHHLDELGRKAEAEAWEKRRRDLVEEQFELSKAMLSKVDQMLKFPLVRQTVEGESGPVTIEPVRWNMNSAARMAKIAIELGRLASGLPTRHEQAVHFEIDPTQLTDEQIERILNGEHPAAVIATGAKGDSV